MSIESCQAFPASQGIDFLGKIHCLDSATAQWIRITFHLANPGSSPNHTIYAFVIYSQICALFVFELKNKTKRGIVWPIFKKNS